MFSPPVTAALVVGAVIFSVYYYFKSSSGNQQHYEYRSRYPSDPPYRRGSIGSVSSVSNGESDCTICLGMESGRVIRLHCHHIFHDSCLRGWTRTGGSTCPICRRDII